MEIGVVGVGRGGGALAAALADDDAGRPVDYLAGAVAVDTDADDLATLAAIPEERRHPIGMVETGGEGTAGDAARAAAVAREERPELRDALDAVPVGRVDATLVLASLGGGTGAGVAPVVAELLDEVTSTPVYAVGILPGTEEAGGDGDAVGSSGPKRAAAVEDGDADGPDRPLESNAVTGLRGLSDAADGLLLADLDVWRHTGDPYTEAWTRLDDAVAARFGDLFAAGEAADPTPERVLDASEVTNTLAAGGVSVVGAAGSAVDNGAREGVVGGLLDRVTGRDEPDVDAGEAVSVATNAARKAVTHAVSLPCDVSSASRAAVVFHAPPAWLNRRGVERARTLVAEETGVREVRWGDLPDPDAEAFRVTVVLSGVTESDRLDALGDVTEPAELG